MKRIIGILALAALFAGCGTPLPLSQEDREVNIGYGTVDKDVVTTSVSGFKTNRNETVTYSNMYDYLRGRVAGVTVTPDNKIIIRGLNSINGSSDPLILVDGAEVTDLSTINPSDVRSVDVIKDGSSSIYGMRGANGVIIITTRKN